jgi:VTC domain
MFIAAAAKPFVAGNWLTEPFASINLKALEANSGMLERIDNKYVVEQNALQRAIPELAKHFDMLDIDGCRLFTYDTCYFDDDDCRNYFDHHQARHKRIKVRMRKYLEAGLCFVEVKLKDKRGMTIKKRLRCDLNNFGTLDETAGGFIQDVYQSLYRRTFTQQISRTLDMRYKRITLVAKDGGERMTLDNGIHFFMLTGYCVGCINTRPSMYPNIAPASQQCATAQSIIIFEGRCGNWGCWNRDLRRLSPRLLQMYYLDRHMPAQFLAIK